MANFAAAAAAKRYQAQKFAGAKFEPTDIQKEIMKNMHGQYAGTLADYARTGNYQQYAFNPSDPAGLMKTEKTTRACRICGRGAHPGFIYAIWKGHGDMVTLQKCGQCNGTGEVFG